MSQQQGPLIPKHESDATYLNIVAGTLRQKVPEGTPKAKYREYNAGTEKEPNMKSKWELHYDGLDNVRLTGISFEDGDYGEQMKLEFRWADMKLIITVSKKTRFFSDFAVQIPSVDLNNPFTIKPFSFKNEKDKTVSGFTFIQNEQKIDRYAYFYDKETKVSKNGLPDYMLEGADQSKDQQNMYYLQRDMFLKKFLLEQIVPKIPELPKTEIESVGATAEELGKAGFIPPDTPEDDLPF